MRILIALTYYRPHTSGLTIYVERLSKALARRGHQVTVLTSHFDHRLPLEEQSDGVRVVRAPVMLRISKGVIMPTFGWLATRLVLEHDVIHLHLPQFDAAGVALRGRLLGKPTVITYHCDLELPTGPFNRFVNYVVDLMNNLAAIFTHRIVTYTQDFADHSPYLQRYRSKVNVITPPAELPRVSPGEIEAFRAQHNPENHRPVVGMAARFAAEKGVEVLLDALPGILERFPRAQVLFAGQYRDVLGEEAYFQRLIPRIQKYQEEGHWQFLGILDPAKMAAFYPNLDVLVVPSLNSTESFGLVQIEAMMNGVPVVASNLPGVRQPVHMTGMGEIAEIGDAASLKQALLLVLERPDDYRGDPADITRRFSPDVTAAAYEKLFNELRQCG
ncbi:MAG: glycosyltransferase family 4 protein [Anaerolineales bacterium]|nr:glycosyltransferase family 4 protein [Anaerolineales bacterium]